MDRDIVVSDVNISDVAIGRFGTDILADDAASIMESLGALSPHAVDELARGMAKARNINPDAVMVNRQAWKRVRKCAAGTIPLLFTAGTAVQDVQLQVTRPFLPLVLEVSSVFAPFFRIRNILINGDNQLGSTGPIECQTLSEAASQRPPQQYDTVNPSLPLSMEVEMTDLTASRTFSATFAGVQLRK